MQIPWIKFFWTTLPVSILLLTAFLSLIVGLLGRDANGEKKSFLVLSVVWAGLIFAAWKFLGSFKVPIHFLRNEPFHLPELLLVGAALWLLASFILLKKFPSKVLLFLSLTGLFAAFGVTYWLGSNGLNLSISIPSAFLVFDSLAFAFWLVLLGIGILSCLVYEDYFARQKIDAPETYALTLFAISGLLLMVATTHLVVFFLALEVMSLSVYALVGFRKTDLESNESALKYFILGAIAAAFLLYGTALLYGVTGSFDLATIAKAAIPADQLAIFKFALIFIFTVFAFKIAAVPFHFWTPDVYQGAPLPVTGFMSTAVKTAAFGALLRVLPAFIAFPLFPTKSVLTIIAIATMVVANLVALSQTNLKRLLAYSSIAHAGYVLVGVCTAVQNGVFKADLLTPILFYLSAYSILSLGAFAVAAAFSNRFERSEISDYAGLSKSAPILSAMLSLFMIGLTGIPPTLGFSAKFALFREAMQAGQTTLVIVAVLMSAVSAYYYLAVVISLYFKKGQTDASIQSIPQTNWGLKCVIAACAIATFYFGIFPESLFSLLKIFTRPLA